MLKGNATRHQIVLPEQQEFYDYWRSKCRGALLPSRDDIDPAEIASSLPMVTLTEKISSDDPSHNGHRYLFRLAGTGFWRFYDDDIQGKHVDELPIGCRADYWRRMLDLVMEHRRPFHGVTKPNTPRGAHMAQFWLRLPLASNGRDIDTILGYDHIAPLETALDVRPVRVKNRA